MNDFVKRLVFLAVVLAASAAGAQSVPPLINYQGQLTQPNGSPLPTADYELSFRIYDAASGGNLIWGPQVFDGTSGQGHGPKIPAVQGFFNVMLGPVDTSGGSLASAFDAATRFVEVTIGNHPPIAPRQQILSAPFALRASYAQDAGNAQLLLGKTSGDFVAKAGDTMTGALEVRSPFAVINSSMTERKLSLEYRGDAVARLKVEGAGGDPIALNTGTMDVLTVAGGNVGIGTLTPSALLHLNGGSGDAYLRLETSGSNRAALIEFKDTAGGSYAHIIGQETTLPNGLLMGDNPRALVLAADGPNPIQFGVNGQVAMTVANGGSVGIGTTDPQTKLDVVGTVKATSFQGDGAVPAGCIMAFGGANPPSGWLLCDGRPLRSSDYQSLFAAIARVWGNGSDDSDPATDFNLPDLRGVFLRGVNGSRTGPFSDPGDNRTGSGVGSFQSSAFASHSHENGAFKYLLRVTGLATGSGHDSSPTEPDLVTVGPIQAQGGTETRPNNAYVNYIIKY